MIVSIENNLVAEMAASGWRRTGHLSIIQSLEKLKECMLKAKGWSTARSLRQKCVEEARGKKTRQVGLKKMFVLLRYCVVNTGKVPVTQVGKLLYAPP